MDYNKRQEAFESAKELVKTMNGLSDEGFENRFLHDPFFNRGVHVIVDLYMKQETMTISHTKCNQIYSDILSMSLMNDMHIKARVYGRVTEI